MVNIISTLLLALTATATSISASSLPTRADVAASAPQFARRAPTFQQKSGMKMVARRQRGGNRLAAQRGSGGSGSNGSDSFASSSTSSALSSSSTGTSSSSDSFPGTATFYTQGGNAGACGDYNDDSALIVALQSQLFSSELCGKSLTIKNTDTGLSVTAIVADECPGCASEHSLDLSTGAFSMIGEADTGVLPITWSWN